MNTRTVCFSIGLTMLFTAAPLALQACGGDNGNVTPDTTDGSSDKDTGASTTRPDTSTQGDTSTGNDSSTGGDTSTGDDGGTPTGDAADIPDGGEPSTPGTVQCGATNCDISANTCCFAQDASASCVTGATATCPGNEAELHCLEAADCPSGKICCGQFDLSGKAKTTCETTCSGGLASAQFCRTNSECKNGQPCYVQKCPKNGGAQQQTLELCGHQTLLCD